MTPDPLSHQDAESKSRALWDEIAPVHMKAYKEVALLRAILVRDHRKEGRRT